MRRILVLVFAAVAPLGSGCLPLPYAYPTVCHTPPVAVNADDKSVTAFRVNVVSDHAFALYGGTESPDIAFDLMTKDVTDTTPRAVSVHASGGWVFAPWGRVATHRYACVKLYRRGHRTLVLEPWTDATAVTWQPAETAEERFQAIRDLLYATPWRSASVLVSSNDSADNIRVEEGGIHPTMGWEKGDVTGRFRPRLRPGSWSDEHEKGLRFAQDECKELLDDPTTDEKLKKRVQYLMVRLDEVIER